MLNISNKKSGQENLHAFSSSVTMCWGISGALHSFFRVRRSLFVHGSLTIEAALGLPLLIFFMMVLFTPIHVMNEQRRLQNAMESAAKDIAIRAYIEGLSEEMVSDGELKKDLVDSLFMGWEMLELISIAQRLELGHLKDVRIGDNYILGTGDPVSDTGTGASTEATSDVDAEAGSSGELVFFEFEYEIKWPIELFTLGAYELSSVVNRRKWVGSEGGRGRDKFGEGLKEDGYDIDDEGDPIVYVGKTGTRYHVDKHCHYIDNVMTAVAGEDIDELRNSSGSRYHACPSCDASPEGTVYIFESGTSYHSSEDCKAVGSYARICKLSEVEHLGACSYCGAAQE